MKKTTIIFLSILFLLSCESQENKNSRMTIDKYTRKLNSMIVDVINSRKEEGSQSRLTLNRFYDRYTSKFENFNNDFEFEIISNKYAPNRDELIVVSRNIYEYLNKRKNAIIHMSDAMSDYKSAIQYGEDYDEYFNKMISSTYSRDFYLDMAMKSSNRKFEESLEFLLSKYSYLDDLKYMDSLYILIDSISLTYNQTLPNNKLAEEIYVPVNFKDTINDWLITSKKYIEILEID